MKYGFVIDNRKCIGCHACTVACKTENHIPVGVNRTWVKYVEKGRYPNVRRFFQVMRCNHCENAPCATICPVNAMFLSSDGVVDFNSERCVGCRACMQACPYDAIYIDPVHNTAAKCNFCAHRLEIGLEPACAAVCPEQAIVAGNLDDPQSAVSQLLARQSVRTRKPEQGTKPKVFYVGADDAAMVPTAARHEPFYMFAQRGRGKEGGGTAYLPLSPYHISHALAAYDVPHQKVWGWQVPVFFWLKSILSGLLAVPALAMAFGSMPVHRMRDTALALQSLILLAASLMILITDLSRRGRFGKILVQPQGRSWVTRGAFILAGYGLLCGGYFLAGILGKEAVFDALLWPTVLAGFLAAAYSAWLLTQCEGCDLWQNPLMPLHLIVQAIMAGGGFLAILPAAMGGGAPETRFVAALAIASSLALHLLIILFKFGTSPNTDNAGYAARLITRGPYRVPFWAGAVAAGGILPSILLIAGRANAVAVAAAGMLALAGLLAYEWCFIMAGQRVPNS